MAAVSLNNVERVELQRSKRRRRRALTLLSCIAIVATALALMVPALSMTRGALACGFDEHTHSEECYETVLVCDQDESDDHIHSSECYEEQLVCDLEEHVHSSVCYSTPEGELAASESAELSGQENEFDYETEDAEDDQQDGSGNAEGAPGIYEETGIGLAAGGEGQSAPWPAGLDSSQGTQDALFPAQQFTSSPKDENGNVVLTVKVEAPQGALPAGSSMVVEPVWDAKVLDAARQAAKDEVEGIKTASAHSVRVVAADITFTDAAGLKVEPQADVRVDIATPEIASVVSKEEATDNLAVVHIADNLDAEPVTSPEINDEQDAVVFEAADFSMYAVVYTVDFRYVAEGASYDYGIPGGGFASLSNIISELGVVGHGTVDSDDPDDVATFVTDVARVEFSSPELMLVAKVEEDTTVGALKSSLDAHCEYSSDMTDDRIAEIDATRILAPDWALVSLKPFSNEETLTITMRNGEQFAIQVTDAQIKKSAISASGGSYEITLTYTDSALIPDGSELNVREVLEDTPEFERYLKEASAALNSEDSFISHARFFDIEIEHDGQKVEPAVPVEVTMRYADAVQMDTGDTLSVVHFPSSDSANDLEVITDVVFDEDTAEIIYDQDSFSVTGTVVQTPVNNHYYALVVHHTDGEYYVIENDGTLAQIDESSIDFNGDGSVKSVKMINPISWVYQDIGYNNYVIWHDTDAWAYDYPGTSLPKHYTRRYINVHENSGYQDVHDTSVNVWNENLQYDGNKRLLHQGQDTLTVGETAGGILVIQGNGTYSNAAEIYLAEAQQVPNASPRNHTVNHIDISVEASAGIKVPLAYGSYRLATVDEAGNITGYRDQPLVVSKGNDVTLEIERTVPITKEDLKKANITAYIDYTGQRVYLDDVYSVTGYSGNAETGTDTAQVRLEGSFKVSDLNPLPATYNESQANYSYYENTGKQIRAVRLERPIHYTVEITKPVTFTMVYRDEATGIEYVVLKSDNMPFEKTIDVTLDSSFTYWDEDNTCPGIHAVSWTYGTQKWKDGEIWSNDNAGIHSSQGDNVLLDAGPGMDFRLGAPADDTRHDIVAIEVQKYVQGVFGSGEEAETRTLELAEETECSVDVYQNGPEPLHEKTIAVGTDGMGMIYDYDVEAGKYESPAHASIAEDPSSVADELVDAEGNRWIYQHSRVETEFAWRSNGQNNPDRYVSQDYTKGDGPYRSHQEVIGEYTVDNPVGYWHDGVWHNGDKEFNRFLEFYVYNIYEPKKYPVRIKKVDTANPSAINGLQGAQFDLYGPYETDRSSDDAAEGTGRKETKINDGTIATLGDGTVSLGNLGTGIYYLYETKSPDGYILLTSPVKIVVDSKSEGTADPVVAYYQDDSSIDTDGDKSGWAYVTTDDGGDDIDNPYYQLSVTNSAGAALPNTGGSGVLLLYAVGVLAIVGSTIMLGSRFRVRGKRLVK